MNQQQRKYAKERVSGLTQQKINEIKQRFVTKGSSLTDTDRLKEFKKGNFKVSADVKYIDHYTRVTNLITFTNDVPDEFDKEGYDKAVETIRTRSNVVLDEIMLGDAEEAYRLIQSFKDEEF